MKLYTEEKLRNSMLSMKTYINMYDESVIDRIIENHIKALGVVELPSDEEVEQYLKSFPYTKHLDDGQYNDGKIVGAELAIQWFRNKIQ